jgi:hypothetical protein
MREVDVTTHANQVFELAKKLLWFLIDYYATNSQNTFKR